MTRHTFKKLIMINYLLNVMLAMNMTIFIETLPNLHPLNKSRENRETSGKNAKE